MNSPHSRRERYSISSFTPPTGRRNCAKPCQLCFCYSFVISLSLCLSLLFCISVTFRYLTVYLNCCSGVILRCYKARPLLHKTLTNPSDTFCVVVKFGKNCIPHLCFIFRFVPSVFFYARKRYSAGLEIQEQALRVLHLLRDRLCRAHAQAEKEGGSIQKKKK